MSEGAPVFVVLRPQFAEPTEEFLNGVAKKIKAIDPEKVMSAGVVAENDRERIGFEGVVVVWLAGGTDEENRAILDRIHELGLNPTPIHTRPAM